MSKKPINAGFTLVEMIVVIALLGLLVGVVFNLFASGFSSQRNTLSVQKSTNQLSYIAEYMGRALRQATKDLNGTCITAKKNFEVVSGELRFLDKASRCRAFFLAGTQIKEKISPDSSSSGLVGTDQPLTPSGMSVTNFNVVLQGEVQTDAMQPRITFVMEAEGEGSTAKVRLQTTVSQRNFDVQQ